SHRVLHVRWNIQEASDRVTFEVLQIRRFAKADLQGALQHGNPGVRSVRVKIMESRGNEGRVSKRLAWLLASSFKYRPFGSRRIDFLPNNRFRVPGLWRFGWFGCRSCT